MPQRKSAILIVDDDPVVLHALTLTLQATGYEVKTASSPENLDVLIRSVRPALVLMDVLLGREDGREICRALRRDPATATLPVILISANRKEEDDQAYGLEAGADDYLLKPVKPRLLRARVESVLRRFSAPADCSAVLQESGLRLDVPGRRVQVGKEDVLLTRKEFDLLVAFMRARGRPLSPTFLLEAVWGYDTADYNDTHTVEVHVSSLRRKLGKKFSSRLTTMVGTGYRLD